RLGVALVPGLREVVGRTAPLARVLQETEQPGLWALAAGAAIPAGSPWPAGKALRSVFQQLRNHFDWVLVDAPAWDGGPEMAALAAGCDAVYLVVRPGEIEAPTVSELGRLIPHLGSQLGGYILTQR